MTQNVLSVLVVTDMGTVKGLHYLAVDASWGNTQLPPDLLALLRSTLDIEELTLLAAELGKCRMAHVRRNLLYGASLGGYVQKPRYRIQLLHILDLVIGCLSFSSGNKGQSHATAVVGVGSGSCSDHAYEVPRRYSLYGRPANTDRSLAS